MTEDDLTGTGLSDTRAEPEAPRRPVVSFFVVGVCVGVLLGVAISEWVQRRSIDAAVASTAESLTTHSGTVVADPLAPPQNREGPLPSTGFARLDAAWATIERYYPEEAARVTAVRPTTGPMADYYRAWVLGGRYKTEIFIAQTYVAQATQLQLEIVLAHELMHITQSFDAERADYYAGQREASLRESHFALLRERELMP